MSKTLTIGKVALTPKGEYSSTASYEELDVVRYQGSSYVVNKACSGITPVEGEYYTLLAEKGKDGEPGKKGDPGEPGKNGNNASISGGTTDQILAKASNEDGDFKWVDKPQGDVQSFNGRKGAVVPEEGDYTPEMVGAAPEDHTHTPTDIGAAAANHTHTPESIGAAAAVHDHNDLYLPRSQTMTREQIEELVDEKTENGSGFTKIYLGSPTNVSVTNTDEGAIIKWTDPEDVVVSGATLAKWAGTVLVRKAGSAPQSKTDGTILIDSTGRDTYKTTGYQDTGLVNETTYFYGIFPYSVDGIYTCDKVVSIKPQAIYPDAASNITVTNLDEACRVAYTKPANATSVKVVYKAGSAATTPEEGTAINATSSPVTINGLTNDTKYFITVFTFNAKRYKAADAVQFTPKAILPSAPTDVSIENLILSAKISYTKPSDATSIKIVYKAGSKPTSPTDGTSVTSSSSPTTISGLTNGTTYYFVVYAFNAKRYKGAEAVSIVAREAEHYAFVINDAESVCKSKINYPSGVDNSNFTAAGLNGSSFSYGSWANAFFIKKLKVVMLNFDGTEAYEINKNDYKKKAAGGNVGTEGNVMVAIPKVYYKVTTSGNTIRVDVSDVALDADYKCWAHIGLDGVEKDYCYMNAYNPCLQDGKLRSLTGKTPSVNQNASTEITEATANNPGSKKNWYTGVVADRFLIQILLLLIGKNTHTQEQFGQGRTANSNSSALATGTMDDKGLFWGDTGGVNGVKVFGIEHFWGNLWQRIAGWINNKGTEKIKMTYGTQDGSTVTGYNLDGSGYVTTGNVVTSDKSGYIGKMKGHKFGLIPDPNNLTASDTTGYADYEWFYKSDIYYAFVGG
ncbi:MAG: hypothetical protein NC548_13275, partial [Lachnospiraceae bacterium]|nr:hypothetical protein [Lachnospiraceae bacterium]